MLAKRNRSKHNLAASALALALLGGAFAANAATLGNLNVYGRLGMPLRAAVDFKDTAEIEPSTIKIKIADSSVYAQAGAKRPAWADSVTLGTKRQGARLVIEISTANPVSDPASSLILQVDWDGGSAKREYALILDPAETESTSVEQTVTDKNAKLKNKRLSTGKIKQIGSSTTPMPETQSEKSPSTHSDAVITVKRGDSLSKIVAAHPVKGASAEQAMMAYVKLNAGAFQNGNANLLASGSTLSIPTTEAATAITAEDAKSQIGKMNKSWREHALQVADYSQASAPLAATKVEGKIAPATKPVAAVAPAPDKLALEKTPAANSKTANIAKEKELQEQRSRIADLEKTHTDLIRLLEIREAELARLQGNAKAPLKAAPAANAAVPIKPATPAATAAVPASAVAPVKSATPATAPASANAAVATKPAPASAPAATNVAVATKPAPSPTPPAATANAAVPVKPATPVPAAANAVTVEAPVAVKPPATTDANPAAPANSNAAVAKPPVKAAPKPPVKTVAPPPPPVEAEPEMIEDIIANLPLIGAGLAGLLAIFGLFKFFKTKQRKQAIAEWKTVSGPVTVTPRSTTRSTKTQNINIDGELTPEQKVEERFQAAETYCAFGHFDKARDEINEALSFLPGNPEAFLRLCKIEAQERNQPNFKDAFDRLAQATNETGPLWREAMALQSTLQDGKAVATDLDFVKDLKSFVATTGTKDEPSMPTLPESPQPEQKAANFTVKTSPSVPASPKEPEPMAHDNFLSELDLPMFDAATIQMPNDPPPKVIAAQAPPPSAPVALAKNEEPLSLDFDLELGSALDAPTLDLEVATTHDTMPQALDFDMGSITDPITPQQVDFPTSTESDGALSLDLGMGLDMTTTPSTDSSFSFDAPNNAASDSPEDSECRTMMDLAEAYIEMGDTEGAKDILKELAGRNSPSWAKKATERLSNLV